MTDLRRPDPKRFANARDHRRLWRLVEGAVVDALKTHPEYLTGAGERWAVQSITKRVVGQLVGHAKEAQRGGRGSASCDGSRDFPRDPQRDAAGAASRTPGLLARLKGVFHAR